MNGFSVSAPDREKATNLAAVGSLAGILLLTVAFTVWFRGYTYRNGWHHYWWSSDACYPDPNTICGMFPASTFVSIGVGIILFAGWTVAIQKFGWGESK